MGNCVFQNCVSNQKVTKYKIIVCDIHSTKISSLFFLSLPLPSLFLSSANVYCSVYCMFQAHLSSDILNFCLPCLLVSKVIQQQKENFLIPAFVTKLLEIRFREHLTIIQH